MSGPKRNPDKLNTIGVVVVGICGAVLVYVTIVALEAFYMNDTSEIQTMADYGGQDIGAKSLRTEQVNRVGEYGTNTPGKAKPNEPAPQQTYRIPVDEAMKLVVGEAKKDASDLIPGVGKSEKATVLPIFGRPKPLAAPPPATPPAGAGSAATAPPAAPMTPTGAGTQPSPVNGAGPLDKSPTPNKPTATPGAATPKNPEKGGAAKGPSTPGAGSATMPAKKPAGTGSGSAAPKGNGK